MGKKLFVPLYCLRGYRTEARENGRLIGGSTFFIKNIYKNDLSEKV